jgi:hypothetical protein
MLMTSRMNPSHGSSSGGVGVEDAVVLVSRRCSMPVSEDSDAVHAAAGWTVTVSRVVVEEREKTTRT